MEIERKSETLTGPRAGHGRPEARRLSRRWVPLVAIIVVIGAIASSLYSLNRPTIPDEIEGLILYDDLTSEPVDQPVSYSQEPPAGGRHAPESLECGRYFVPVENERAVAALATGAIWIAYNPEISASEISDLELFGEGKPDIFLAPYPGLPEPFVITAWGAQLHPDSTTDPRIASFIRDYRNADAAPYPDLPCREGEQIP